MGDILDFFFPAPRVYHWIPTFVLARECSKAEIRDQEFGSLLLSLGPTISGSAAEVWATVAALSLSRKGPDLDAHLTFEEGGSEYVMCTVFDIPASFLRH